MSAAAEADLPGLDPLERARRAGLLTALDVHFARRLATMLGEPSSAVRGAIALVCRQEQRGHVCADLLRLEAEGLVDEEGLLLDGLALLSGGRTAAEWIRLLGESALVERSGGDASDRPAPSPVRPLVLDAQGRLYLQRMYRAELELARAIAQRAALPDLVPPDPDAAAEIESALTDRGFSIDDERRKALAVGLARPLAIWVGGPGTGKTTLVARLVRLLVREGMTAGRKAPRVLLLAPTGKAAAALAGSFARERAVPGLAETIRAALPNGAQTIHRALARAGPSGAAGDRSPRARGLEADVVIVDEASMVDLAQMTRLLRACEGVGRLVLLGDPRQLASVEAGAVLADLVGEEDGSGAPRSKAPNAALAASVVRLTHSHRYSESGGIGRLADAVRVGNADTALALLGDPGITEVERCDVGEGSRAAEGLVARLAVRVRELERAVLEQLLPEEKLARLGDYRVLCAHRRGPLGVEALARALDAVAALERRASPRAGDWPGRLLLVTRNAPEQSLWNGDIGLVERVEGGLRALFTDASGGVRVLSLARLPAHESAIAMSVHKSQGSEFRFVDLVLGTRSSPIMTRELLYTGITRAREGLRIHASEAVLRAAIARRARRDSGLADRLGAE